MKKILSILICSVLILSLASCSSYQDAPQASFTDETETLELEGFSLEYPACWNPIGETDPEAVYNEPIFEATSPLEDGIICSSVILVRASSTDQKKLEKMQEAQAKMQNYAALNTRSIESKASYVNKDATTDDGDSSSTPANYAPGSMAAKANMVNEFNKRNSK